MKKPLFITTLLFSVVLFLGLTRSINLDNSGSNAKLFAEAGTLESDIYNFGFVDLEGNQRKFSEFKGKKILIVNTASKCGYTGQYADLQKLHEKHGDKLVIIGFPANNFGGQEPLNNKEIEEFCEKNYGVSFLMAEKVSVKGKDISPVFNWLTQAPNNSFTGDIRWNFEKFLINENGKLEARYRSGVKPMDDKITTLL
ncbi:MAG: glutathione peroxidase [Luteibaculaceae bacterium]